MIVRAGPGAGASGTRSVTTAESDGHTLMVGSASNLLTAPLIYKAPVTIVERSHRLLVFRQLKFWQCIHGLCQVCIEISALAKSRPAR